MSDNEKRLRYDVLMTAIGIVDQGLYWKKDNGEAVTAPPVSAYIEKAEQLMKFVDNTPDPVDPMVDSVKQLLTEHSGK